MRFKLPDLFPSLLRTEDAIVGVIFAFGFGLLIATVIAKVTFLKGAE